MSSTEETIVVINGVTLTPDQVQSLWAAAQSYKLKLRGDRFSEDRILRFLSNEFLPYISSVEALFAQPVNKKQP